MKQGDLLYNIINSMGNQFWFYRAVLKGDGIVGYWHVEFDLFPGNGKALKLSCHQCTTLQDGEDEPEHDAQHDKVTAAIDNMEVLQVEAEIDESCELALLDSSDDEQHDNSAKTQTKKTPKKRKSRKVLAIESFLQMSNEGVLNAKKIIIFMVKGLETLLSEQSWLMVKRFPMMSWHILQMMHLHLI